MKKTIKLSILASAFLFTGCYFPTSIDSGEIGVVKNWGEVQPEIKQAGLTFSLTPGDDLYVMRTTNKQIVFTDRKVEENGEIDDTIYSPGIVVLTEQQLPVPLDVSCLYQLNPSQATNIIKQYGEDGVWDDKLVVRVVRSTVRDEIGQVSLENLSKNRSIYEDKIRVALNTVLNKYGVTITTFNIQNIGIPVTIQQAILAKETANQNAEKAKYQVMQAKAEAEVEVAKAQGIAQANNILADSLTDKLVQYKKLDIQTIQANKWDGKMPNTVVGGNTPIILDSK